MRRARPAFTMTEILVVIAILGLLMGLSVTVYFRMMGGQQRRNTEMTLEKLASQMRQAWTRVIENARDKPVHPLVLSNLAGGDPQRAKVIWIKMHLKQQFPMTFAEATANQIIGGVPVLPAEPAYVRALQSVGGSHRASTEMGACLYLALTAVGRRGASTEADVLSSLEKRDTDNDGIPELVDGWRNPLGFFRWPYSQVPPIPAPPFVDPDDPSGTLQATGWQATAAYTTFCTNVLGHVVENKPVYPVLVSAGPDGSLLLKAAPTSPMLYLGYGDFFMTPTAPPNYGLPAPPLGPPTSDNIIVTTQQ